MRPDDGLQEYIDAHIEAEPAELQEVWRRTHLCTTYPRMCSGHSQGRLLKMLTLMVRPRCVVELGAFTGYSAMCIAEGLPEGGELHTVEHDEEIEELLRSNLALSPRREAIHLHMGDALEVVPRLGLTFDMAFIDANKRHYAEYLEMLLPQMSSGGIVIADNTLWDGHIGDACRHDPQTEGIRRFNDLVASHPRLTAAMIPLRDGLTLIRVN